MKTSFFAMMALFSVVFHQQLVACMLCCHLSLDVEKDRVAGSLTYEHVLCNLQVQYE
jgi:hypothetical protein